MLTLTKHITRTLEVKQSKFIAHLLPYSLYKEVLSALKEDHPKARHFVTAFRHLNEFDQVVEGSSDDGEPKGTSGKPTLAVLQGQNLINIAVITVRYFGGTKLGTGGLVRAYSDATNLALEDAELFDYVKLQSLSFHVNYSNLSMVEYALEQSGITRIDKTFEAAHVAMVIMASADEIQIFRNEVKRLIKVL